MLTDYYNALELPMNSQIQENIFLNENVSSLKVRRKMYLTFSYKKFLIIFTMIYVTNI